MLLMTEDQLDERFKVILRGESVADKKVQKEENKITNDSLLFMVNNPNNSLTDRLLAQLILDTREQKDILRVIKNKYLESL